MSEAPAKARRGFALMTPERLRAVSARGGKRAQALGRAHQFTAEEAREVGRKGGLASAARRAAKP
jgi:general stress protein YciG